MAFWNHCNVCYTLYKDKKGEFYISNCGHIYCEGCIGRLTLNNNNICFCCKQNVTNHTLLSNDMDGNLKRFFMKYRDSFDNSLSVVDFQFSNAEKYIKYLQHKQIKMQHFIDTLGKREEHYKKQLNNMRQHIMKQKQMLQTSGNNSRNELFNTTLSSSILQSPGSSITMGRTFPGQAIRTNSSFISNATSTPMSNYSAQPELSGGSTLRNQGMLHRPNINLPQTHLSRSGLHTSRSNTTPVMSRLSLLMDKHRRSK